MKKIILKDKSLDDCEKIQKIFADRGYAITITQANFLWEKFSAEMCSGWLCFLSSDDQIFKSVQSYWRETEDLDMILEKAIVLIETGECTCLFEALDTASGAGWNRGFGTDENKVTWTDSLFDGKRTSHPAYAAVRLAIDELGQKGQVIICFSRSASKKSKLAVLRLAKKIGETCLKEN